MSTQEQRRKPQTRIRDYLDDANDEYSLYHGREYLKGFGDFTPPRKRNEVKNANVGVPLKPSLDYDYLLKKSHIGDPQSSLSLDPLRLVVTAVFPPVLFLGIAAAAFGFLTRRMWFTSREFPSENVENLTTQANGEEDMATSNSNNNTNAINYDDKSLTVSSKKCNKKETTDHDTNRDAENDSNYPSSPIEKINIDGDICDEPHNELPRKKLIFGDNNNDEGGETSEVPSLIITEHNKFSQMSNENVSNPPGLVDEVYLSAVELHYAKPSSDNYDVMIHPSKAQSSLFENDQSHFSTPLKHQNEMVIPNSIYKTPAEYNLNKLLTPHKSRMPSGIDTMESRHSNEIVSSKNTFQPHQFSTPSTGQEICSIHFPREAVVSYFQSPGLSREKSLELAANLEIKLFILNQSMACINGLFGCFNAQWCSQHHETYEQRERHHDQQMKARPIEKLRRLRKKFSFGMLNPTRLCSCIYWSLLGLGLSLFGRVWDETMIGILWNVVRVLISRLCPECNAQSTCTETSWASYFMRVSDWFGYPLQYIQSSPYYCHFGCVARLFLCAIIVALSSRFINKVAGSGCVSSCATVSLMIMSHELRLLGAGVGLWSMTLLLCMNTHRYCVDPSRDWQSSSSNTSRSAKELTIEEVNQKVDWYESAFQRYQYVAYFMSLCIGIYTGRYLYETV